MALDYYGSMTHDPNLVSSKAQSMMINCSNVFESATWDSRLQRVTGPGCSRFLAIIFCFAFSSMVVEHGNLFVCVVSHLDLSSHSAIFDLDYPSCSRNGSLALTLYYCVSLNFI